MAESNFWSEFFQWLDNGRLAIIMVFGVGILYALGWSIASIVRAVNGSPDDTDALAARLAELEARLDSQEQRDHVAADGISVKTAPSR